MPNGPGYPAPAPGPSGATRDAAAPASQAPAPPASAAGTGSLLDGLDPQQRAAATADGPLLIIAGPGSGKTRTLTYRIAHQVTDRGLAAGSFLAITFTRRAAQELQDRLAGLCPGQPTVTTFHGLGLRILRENHEAAGLGPQFKVADETVRLQVATELTGSDRDGRKLIAGLDPDGRLALRRELTARDLVDFDGLVELAAALLRDDPDVAAGLRARWPQVSVDEYQDIDAVQYDLLRMISGDGRGLTAIGDPDQAIYRFRGADVGIFGRFAADFPGATTVELSRNYRSSPAIVTAAMQAIAPATLVPGRTAVAVRSGPAGVVTFDEAADEHAEAAWIAATIDQLLGGASFHSLDSGRADGHAHGKLGLADIAVLYRTDAQAGPLGQALTRAGLPFQKRSHDLLARRPAVADIIREMRLTDPGAHSRRSRRRRCRRAAHGRGTRPGRGARRARRDGRRRPRGGRTARAAGPPVRRRPRAFPGRDLAGRGNGRAGSARRGDHPADPARRQGAGVRRGVPGRLRARPAATVAARRGRGGRRRGAAAAVRRDDPGP